MKHEKNKPFRSYRKVWEDTPHRRRITGHTSAGVWFELIIVRLRFGIIAERTRFLDGVGYPSVRYLGSTIG